MVTPSLAVLQVTLCQAPGDRGCSWQGVLEPPRTETQPLDQQGAWSCLPVSSPICLSQTLWHRQAITESWAVGPLERGQTTGHVPGRGGFPIPAARPALGTVVSKWSDDGMMPAMMQPQQAVAVVVAVIVVVITIRTTLSVSDRVGRRPVPQAAARHCCLHGSCTVWGAGALDQ